MRSGTSSRLLSLVLLLLSASPLPAQDHGAVRGVGLQSWFALIELPALAVAVVFSFLTAAALRGGRLGAGMVLIAWGFLIMAVGHLHMQLEMFLGFNLFATLFGESGGRLAWIVALVVTWTLTGLGFVRLYQASVRV